MNTIATDLHAKPQRNADVPAEVDVVVIGGGAAGLSAALVLIRGRRRVVVIDSGQPRNAPAAHMQGFPSRDGMPPHELLTVGRDEVAGYGGHLLADTVTNVHAVGGSTRRASWSPPRLEGSSAPGASW
jgi:thioredoxin reductase